MLMRPEMAIAGRVLGAVAALLGALGVASVVKAVLIDHETLNGAWVGGNYQGCLGW